MDTGQLIKRYTEDFVASKPFLELPDHLKQEAVSDVEIFLDCLFNYELDDLKKIQPQNIKTVLTEIFPRKVSDEPEEFRSFIPVLVSFFEFLKERGVAKEADSLIKAVKDSEEEMIKNARNPKYWGVAKTFVMQMKKDGVSISDKEAVDRWIIEYNQRQKVYTEDIRGMNSFSKTKPKVGRNDPCPCGSGKKYKKCCLNKTEPLITHPIKDYGPARLSDDFFIENPVKELSAARFIYSHLLNPGIEEIAGETVRPFIPEERWRREEEKINQETSLEGLLKIMGECPDPVNYALLKRKILSFSNLAVLKIVEKLKDNQDDGFVELGIRIIYESKIDCSTQLLSILDSIKHPYTLSLVCLLLGLIGPGEAIQPVWNCYHFLKDNYPEEAYEQGPLLALHEFKNRFG